MSSRSRSIPHASAADAFAASPASVSDAVEWMRKRFRPDRALGVRVAYQFELAGEGGGGIWAQVDDGRLEVCPGTRPAPDVTLRMQAADLFGILAGRANPDLLFMERRIEIDGDLSLALKLRSLFS